MTIWFVAVAAVISFDWWSIVRSMSVIRRPNDAALVTSLPAMWQMYGWCVWALTMTVDARVEPVRDALHLGPVEVHALVDVGVCVAGSAGGAGAGGRRGRDLGAALVQQHDERLDALLVAELLRRAR